MNNQENEPTNENYIEIYQKGLNDTPKPIPYLARFYSQLFDIEINQKLIIMIGKLLKGYGRWHTFNAIVSLYDANGVIDFREPYPLLAYFCKKDIAKQNGDLKDLTKYIEEQKKEIEESRQRHLVIPNPFEDK